jgi:hypothetical protein
MQTYLVTRTIEIEAETPLEAAREACVAQRDPYCTENLFGVGYYLEDGRWHDEEIDLGYDNPLGRPAATISGDTVCCGYCGSPLTEYLEDVGRHAPLFARFGVALCDPAKLDTYEEGMDERVICGECGRESQLPASFKWA